MKKKRLAGGILVTTAAAVVLGATSAFAATSITVTNPNSNGSFTGSSSMVTLADATAGTSGTCQTSGATNASDTNGTIPSGTYSVPPDAQVGTIAALTFNNCQGPLGAATATTNTPLQMFLHQKDPSNSSQFDGYLQNMGGSGAVLAHIVMPPCTFDVAGQAPAYYDTSNHTLVLDATRQSAAGAVGLTATNVAAGCLGVVNQGDSVQFTAIYTVSPNITITAH